MDLAHGHRGVRKPNESIVNNASIKHQSGVNPDLEALNRNAPVTL